MEEPAVGSPECLVVPRWFDASGLASPPLPPVDVSLDRLLIHLPLEIGYLLGFIARGVSSGLPVCRASKSWGYDTRDRLNAGTSACGVGGVGARAGFSVEFDELDTPESETMLGNSSI